MNDHPVAALGPAMVDHSSVGRDETAAETGRGLQGHVVRHPNEVDLRMIDRHKLRERSPVGEPGLELSVTHLVFTPSAGLTLAARADERSRDPVTEVPSLYPRADLGDHAGKFMARNQGSGHGENIHAVGEGRGRPHSGRVELYRCRSTACWVSSRVVKASRGHRFSPPSSHRCSHMRLYLQHPGRTKTVARQQTRLTGPPPMSGLLGPGWN